MADDQQPQAESLHEYITQGKFYGKRYFGKGVAGTVQHFKKRGWRGLEHTAGKGATSGFTTAKDGKIQRLEFANTAISKAASDDFYDVHNITDDIFTEFIDGGSSKMIEMIEYSPARLLMRVKFANKGSIVLYDHVPPSVFAELKVTADSAWGLGERFWDIIRIHVRGNFVREGSKYPYTTLYRGYVPLPTIDGVKRDPDRTGREYRTEYTDLFTGEKRRETKSERAQREEKRVEKIAAERQQGAVSKATQVVDKTIKLSNFAKEQGHRRGEFMDFAGKRKSLEYDEIVEQWNIKLRKEKNR